MCIRDRYKSLWIVKVRNSDIANITEELQNKMSYFFSFFFMCSCERKKWEIFEKLIEYWEKCTLEIGTLLTSGESRISCWEGQKIKWKREAKKEVIGFENFAKNWIFPSYFFRMLIKFINLILKKWSEKSNFSQHFWTQWLFFLRARPAWRGAPPL